MKNWNIYQVYYKICSQSVNWFTESGNKPLQVGNLFADLNKLEEGGFSAWKKQVVEKTG
jgi:hypothetical protein